MNNMLFHFILKRVNNWKLFNQLKIKVFALNMYYFAFVIYKSYYFEVESYLAFCERVTPAQF